MNQSSRELTDGLGSNQVLAFAAEVTRILEELGLEACVIGGVANARWGEPRQTADVEVTISLQFGMESEAAEKLLSRFRSRIEEPEKFAAENRILLLENTAGIGLDASLGGFPFEERMMRRSSLWNVPNHGEIRTCSAEDLVVLKAFANRPQDWIDIEKVVIRHGKKLNREMIAEELTPLAELKEEPEIVDRLKALFQSSA